MDNRQGGKAAGGQCLLPFRIPEQMLRCKHANQDHQPACRRAAQTRSAITGISYDMLRHYASGRRGMKSLTAIKIERGARKLRIDLRREDLNDGCAQCEFRTGLPQVSGTDEDSREVTAWATGP